MRVLAVDTTAPVVGVALLGPWGVLERVQRVQRGAEALLTPWIRELLAEAGISAADLDGVAVARGPGAFTGLRVGLATAAGLAQGAGVPLWSTDSLHPRAVSALGADLPVLSWLDARKGRAYAAWYGPDGTLLRAPADLPPGEVLEGARAPFLSVGEGALVWGDAVRRAGGRVVERAGDPAVGVLARLGAEGLARGEGGEPSSVRPLYLRAPDARPPRLD